MTAYQHVINLVLYSTETLHLTVPLFQRKEKGQLEICPREGMKGVVCVSFMKLLLYIFRLFR